MLGMMGHMLDRIHGDIVSVPKPGAEANYASRLDFFCTESRRSQARGLSLRPIRMGQALTRSE